MLGGELGRELDPGAVVSHEPKNERRSIVDLERQQPELPAANGRRGPQVLLASRQTLECDAVTPREPCKLERARLGQVEALINVRHAASIGISSVETQVRSPGRTPPHCLRHTFGSVAIEQNMGLVQLKEIMGHSNISSTMIYLRMSPKGLRESLDRIELF